MMNQNQTIKEFELIGPSDFASQHNKKKRLRFESDTANHTAVLQRSVSFNAVRERHGCPVYVQSPFSSSWIVNWLHTFLATFNKHLVNHPIKTSKSGSLSLSDLLFC